ncbi:hypothetical protein DFH11DRAFT_1500977 [Phellopilus nigrolimitatus]|nr:hypothetical protein DFH11DRAFT_1500977 [Phellopilus nigrolimitatus]
MESAAQCIEDANATRYLNGIGLVIMLYDHILTFGDEVRFVWHAKPSFAKKAFLANRYLVPAVLIGVANVMNRFDDNSVITDTTCRNFFTFSSLLGVISIGIGNVLVLLRVINLWERNRVKSIFMMMGFLISFFATFSLMVVVIVKMLPGLTYIKEVHMCVSTIKVDELSAVWASPMLFEVIVLVLVCWNSLDRPRSQDSQLARSLARDGMGYFAVLTGAFPARCMTYARYVADITCLALRFFNLMLACFVKPTLTILGVFFVWAMTTLVLNRALLNIQSAASRQKQSASTPGVSYTQPHVLKGFSFGPDDEQCDKLKPKTHDLQNNREIYVIHEVDQA